MPNFKLTGNMIINWVHHITCDVKRTTDSGMMTTWQRKVLSHSDYTILYNTVHKSQKV